MNEILMIVFLRFLFHFNTHDYDKNTTNKTSKRGWIIKPCWLCILEHFLSFQYTHTITHNNIQKVINKYKSKVTSLQNFTKRKLYGKIKQNGDVGNFLPLSKIKA